MSQLENMKSPLGLRTELHKMVVADLLGPAGGEEETVDEATVRSRYVVGMLAPKGQAAVPEADGGHARADGVLRRGATGSR